MGADWFALDGEDIKIQVRDHETGIVIASFKIPKEKLKKDQALSYEVFGVNWR